MFRRIWVDEYVTFAKLDDFGVSVDGVSWSCILNSNSLHKSIPAVFGTVRSSTEIAEIRQRLTPAIKEDFFKVKRMMFDELDTFMFGVNSERIAVLELLDEYLEDPRPVRVVLEEIMQKIRARLHESR